jgi:tetratricopeptide (TPR) repeat protein
VSLALGCAVSQESFKENFVYEPVRATGTIEGSVQLESSHEISPDVVETWKRFGNPQESIDNWRKAVAEATREDMLRSGLIKAPAGGAAPDLVFRVESLETGKPELRLEIVLSVLDHRSRAVIVRYARQAGLGTSMFEYGENMKKGMSSMLADIRRELLNDFQGPAMQARLGTYRAARAAQAHLEQAAAAEAKGDLAAQAAAVRQARQADPAGAAPAAASVRLLYRLCDPEGARRLGEAALKRHPGDGALTAAITGSGISPDPRLCEAQALNREGVAQARAGQRTEALTKLEAARRLAAGLVPKASYNAALILEQAGRAPEALSAYQEARRGFLDPAEEQEALARLTALAQRAKLPAPESADRRYRLGIVRAQQKRYAEAVTEFEGALSEAPWLTDAYYNLGLVCDFSDRPGQALAALRTYLSLAPDSPHLGAVKTKVVELEDKLGAGVPPAK